MRAYTPEAPHAHTHHIHTRPHPLTYLWCGVSVQTPASVHFPPRRHQHAIRYTEVNAKVYRTYRYVVDFVLLLAVTSTSAIFFGGGAIGRSDEELRHRIRLLVWSNVVVQPSAPLVHLPVAWGVVGGFGDWWWI